MTSTAIAHEPEVPPAGRGLVLVVDDDPAVAEVVARYLERAGYRTEIASDGSKAIGAVAALRPDLVVLDIRLPRVDGFEVLRRLRSEDRGRPAVIVLSGRGEESDRVLGLRLGADDYVVKPFSLAELSARVDAVLRRVDTSPAREPPLVFGDLVIDPAARRVSARGTDVALAQREFDLQLFLARHPSQAFSRDELIRRVWHYAFYTDTSTVTVHMRRLRSKIEADPGNPRHLQTVWGVGYRFEP